MNSRPLTRREIAAVLAGLRSLQEVMAAGGGALPPRLNAIAAVGGWVPPLTSQQIDRLCERLNCGQ